MDKYEVMAIGVLSLFLIPVGYIVRWIVAIIRSPKLPRMPTIGSEKWDHGGNELTITFRADGRPEQSILDQIKRQVDEYHGLVLDHINQTGEYREDAQAGIMLEGVSFPLDDEDRIDFDFSFDYRFTRQEEMFLEACFKDGKVKSLSAGD